MENLKQTSIFTKKLPGWIFVVAMFFAAAAVVSIALVSMSIIADIDKTSASIADATQNTVIGCKNLWWYDSQHTLCQNPKSFCGAYMYQGLQTFETEKECENSLVVAEEKCEYGLVVADWKTYTNKTYGYEIKYPSTCWQVQGNDHMYEIRNGGAFVLMGLADKNVNISIDDWFEKQYEYYLSDPDDNPIYAEPYDPTKITDYNFNGILVKKTRPISFDYSGIEFYFKKGTNILYVEYSESDGNDKTFSEKISTLNQILSTFKFVD